MGVSTDAILCYGFRLKDKEGGEEDIAIDWLRKEQGESDEEDGDDQMAFEDFLAKLSGLKRPDDHYDKERYDTDSGYNKSWNDYWAKKNKLEKEIGVALVWHCSSECPMYILAAEASVQTASRGNPIELGQSIAVQDEWRQKIRAFCDRANIRFEEPQFILCSDWS